MRHSVHNMNLRQRVNHFFERYEAPWEIFMIVLAIVYVILSFLPDWVEFPELEVNALVIADWTITAIFLLEFVVRITVAPSRLRYLTHNWLDLIALIPAVRWLRVFRVTRVFRLLRLLRLSKVVGSLDSLGVNFGRFAMLNGFQWMMLGLTCVMLLISVVFFYAEHPVNPAVKNYWDALYIAVYTWATPGYGDILPATTAGRFCGVLLVITGILTWGLFIANLAAFFSTRALEREPKLKVAPLLKEIRHKLNRLDAMNEAELLALQGEVETLVKVQVKELQKHETAANGERATGRN